MTRKVCIAVDDSSVSKGALDWASKALLQPNDEVHIVSVLEPIMRSDYGAVGENSYPVIQNQCKPDPLTLERTQAFLQQCSKETQEKGVKDVHLTTLVSCVGGSADAGRHIVEYARQQDADMILLGSRGMGSLKRAMLGIFGLGSVSAYVVKHADCNVMVHKVPYPAPAAEAKP